MDDATDNCVNGFLDGGIPAVCDSLWSDAAVAAEARLNLRVNSSDLGRGFLQRIDIIRNRQRLDVDKLCDRGGIMMALPIVVAVQPAGFRTIWLMRNSVT